jgi:hypothetical protein
MGVSLKLSLSASAAVSADVCVREGPDGRVPVLGNNVSSAKTGVEGVAAV